MMKSLFSTQMAPVHSSPPAHRLLRLIGAVALYLLFGWLADTVYAAEDLADPLASTHGSVWLQAQDGTRFEALLLETEADIDVTGMIARARVKQRFRNTGDFWVEGIYVFPLPDGSAVEHFRLRTGDRVIEGRIQERTAARKTYETAAVQGKQAGLIEQQRPNVFTTSIANIAPDDVLEIELEYQQTVAYRQGRYHLRFPMVVGPRFHASTPAAADTGTDVSTVVSDRVDNPVYIHITLDPGVPVAALNSSYHDINIRQTDNDRYSIALASSTARADRDFELTWLPEPEQQPRAAVFSQHRDGYDYLLLSILPPDLASLGQRLLPRDVIFVIDISGSMSGASIEQARASLVHALSRLKPQDRFNIIWFNDHADQLFATATPATSRNTRYASSFVNSLRADGGTVMKPALSMALREQPEDGRIRQIVFLTDGNIDNEKELFSLMTDRLGGNRLFTVAIGSAPNAYFMRKSARLGRGTWTLIGKPEEVQQKTIALFEQMESPALINIDVDIDGLDVEVFPQPVADLYLDEPLSVVIRGRQLGDSISLRGDYGETLWQQHVVLDKQINHKGIDTAWAREKITSLMEQYHDAGSEAMRNRLKEKVIQTSMDHHLMSRFTSLVAVDVTPVNSSGLLYSEKLKSALPHGWDPSKIRHPAGQQILLAQLGLPQTASDAGLHMMIATMLFALAMVFLLWRKLT